MNLLGVLTNTLAVLAGGGDGPTGPARICQEKVMHGVMTGIGLCTLYIGISGSLACREPLVFILSLVPGAVIGFLLDIDGALGRFGRWVERRFPGEAGKDTPVAEAFVTAAWCFASAR